MSATALHNARGLLSRSSNLARQSAILLNSSTIPPSRNVSSSPYGRTHVWKRRTPKLPNPVVPSFPQRVVRSDGSTFVHWTTSPRAQIRLTRDVTNHPVWNPAERTSGEAEEEEGKTTGRLGRYARRFGDGAGIGAQEEDMSWVDQFATETGKAPTSKVHHSPAKKKK